MDLSGVARLIRSLGRTATLRRLNGASPSTDVTVKAAVTAWSSGDLEGDIGQATRTARVTNAEIAAATWPGPPRRGDQLIRSEAGVTKEYEILAVDSRAASSSEVIHVLALKG